MLVEWSYRTRFYPGIFKLSSPRTVLELRYVSDKHIIAHLCMELYVINSDTLMKLWATMLFKFQWQMLSFWEELSFGPGFSSISPLRLIRQKTCQRLSVKITATVKNTILFNEVIMNLLRHCNPKKSEKCLSERLINSANPISNIGKIWINKNMKLVIENM